MEEHYRFIRLVHVTAVFASGSLFALRGLDLNLLNFNWMMAAPLRYSSYLIDTVPLVAAILLAGLPSSALERSMLRTVYQDFKGAPAGNDNRGVPDSS